MINVTKDQGHSGLVNFLFLAVLVLHMRTHQLLNDDKNKCKFYDELNMLIISYLPIQDFDDEEWVEVQKVKEKQTTVKKAVSEVFSHIRLIICMYMLIC